MSLRHIYSMWQPQPLECTLHSTQCGNQKLMPYHYHYQTHIILHKTIQTIKYSCISLSLSVSKSNSLKIIPISQNHENILKKILESHMGELFHLKGKINNEFFNQHTYI